MSQMMVCSRGRGCQTVTLREPELSDRILQLLRRANGKHLSLRQIMGHLGLEAGRTGEPAQNVGRTIFELVKLEEYGRISMKGDEHWIEPPREEAEARR